jgi:hypothetical protein
MVRRSIKQILSAAYLETMRQRLCNYCSSAWEIQNSNFENGASLEDLCVVDLYIRELVSSRFVRQLPEKNTKVCIEAGSEEKESSWHSASMPPSSDESLGSAVTTASLSSVGSPANKVRPAADASYTNIGQGSYL